MNNMTLADTEAMVKKLLWKGLLELTREPEETGERRYNLPIFVPGSAEFMMMNDALTDEHPEIATFFDLMTQLPLAGIRPLTVWRWVFQ